ncbi:methyltransferase [archaeon]|nr:methyltransferase [archaeon]
MVYSPAEDSFLIKKEVEKLARGRVLDVGTGSGILAESAAKLKRVSSVLAVDVKPDSISYCKAKIKNKKVKFIVSDLFSKVPKQKFDAIIFNPPYLPQQKDEPKELATEIAGGKHGYEVVERFMDDVNDYLADDGIVLLLFSSLTGKEKVEAMIAEQLMDFVELSKENLSFEQLYVYKIAKSKFRVLLEKKGISDIHPLAKGHRGLIFTGVWKKKKVTIKVQRTDIGAKGTVNNEAVRLKVLNKHNIGPKLLFAGDNFFVYEYVPGDFILDYFEKNGVKKKEMISIIKNVFEQMFILDQLGLNKEEMHHPVKHVILKKGKKPVLLDFERCKSHKNVHNVTQFCQFIISGKLLPYLKKNKIEVNMQDMLNLCRIYSKKRSRENFDRILGLLK